jgi:hypothetical protein
VDERSQDTPPSDARDDSSNRSGRVNERGDADDDDDDVDMIHPLEPGSEAHYRFRTGGTTSIRLSGGRTITLVELEVIPRRAVYWLVSGSLWLDQATHAAVRGTFTLAAPFQPPMDDVPIPLPEMSFTLQYITVEYGLWQDRWWLPKLVAFEGSVSLAGITAPLVWERAYEDYRVYGEGDPIPPLEPIDTIRFRVASTCESERCENRAVRVPRDSSSLLDSPDLPPSIFGNDRLMTAGELDELQDLLETQIAGLGVRALPTLSWDPFDLSLMHYNRVEGLTFGTGAAVEFGPLRASGAATIGTAYLVPRAVLDLTRSRLNGFDRISLYRRVDAFLPDDRPFSLGSSFSAFALGRDNGDYYSATGVSVNRRLGENTGFEVGLGVYAELQRSLEKRTDASIPAWTVDRTFRPNPAADEADQVGATATARWRRGLDPGGFRAGADASLLAEQGTYGFARPALTVRTTFPLPVRLAGALEAGAGTSFGDLPAQREWFVGGQSTVRGFRAEERMVGSAFWRARGEVGSDRPAFRLIVFSDAGWAGDRSAFAATDPLISAGVGVSALDGLVRADLARAIQGGAGRWGLTLYLDAAL